MRRAILVLVAVVVAAGLVAYGRHERAHAVTVEQHRLLDARETAHPVGSRAASTIYNAPLQFTCAFYAAAELCFDPEHRLVESVVKNGPIGTVRWDHAASPWTMPAALWRRVFSKPEPSYYP